MFSTGVGCPFCCYTSPLMSKRVLYLHIAKKHRHLAVADEETTSCATTSNAGIGITA